MKAKIMNFFCLPGSWEWAKKQMLAGYMVRSTEWLGHLKLRAHPQTKALEIDLSYSEMHALWSLGALCLNQDIYAGITTYEIFKWKTVNEIFTDYINLKMQNN